MAGQLSETQLGRMQAYWDAANYLVVALVGDGEAETGPLEGGWKGIRFLNPARDDYVRQHLDDIPEIRDWVWTD